MKKLTNKLTPIKTLIIFTTLTLGILVAENLSTKIYELKGQYNLYRPSYFGEDAIIINGKEYLTSINENELAKLKSGKTYTFTAEKSIFSLLSSDQITSIKDSL
jgi:hypothetical protein